MANFLMTLDQCNAIFLIKIFKVLGRCSQIISLQDPANTPANQEKVSGVIKSDSKVQDVWLSLEKLKFYKPLM